MSKSVAIIGGGVTGLSVTFKLRDRNIKTTVFEKSDTIGGRTATNKKNNCIYDYGANYFKTKKNDIKKIIKGLGLDGLVKIKKPIWTYNFKGQITKGKERDINRLTYKKGIQELAFRLYNKSDTKLYTSTTVKKIDKKNKWIVCTEEKNYKFDFILLTPQPPKIYELIKNTKKKDKLYYHLRDSLKNIRYNHIMTFIFHYPFRQQRPYYALINTDKKHSIGWISREESKQGHIPDGESILIIQMSSRWSKLNLNTSINKLKNQVTEKIVNLINNKKLKKPDWTDSKFWKNALPKNNKIDKQILREIEKDNLFFAGDTTINKGRVHNSLSSGINAAEKIYKKT